MIIAARGVGPRARTREERSCRRRRRPGKPKQSELPSTLRRSPKKAQRTFAKAHDSAADEYGDEKRANQVAWAAVKHSFEKVGDHWEKKAGGKKGPSDAQAGGRRGARTGRPRAASTPTPPRTTCSQLAKKLDISGRSTMKKKQLVDAIQKANDQEDGGRPEEVRAESPCGNRARRLRSDEDQLGLPAVEVPHAVAR